MQYFRIRHSIDTLNFPVFVNKEGIYFITFTCHNWLPLIELTKGYDFVYQFFHVLESHALVRGDTNQYLFSMACWYNQIDTRKSPFVFV